MNVPYEEIKRTPWKVTVWDRLRQVEADVEQAVGVQAWKLVRDGDGRGIEGSADAQPALMLAARAIVRHTFQFIDAASACLDPPGRRTARLRERLTGGLLMSAYANLHAAERQRVLLLSDDQLMAILPSIRQRAIAYLPINDTRRVALDGVPDITAPAHQALARLQQQIAGNVTAAIPGTRQASAGGEPPQSQSGQAPGVTVPAQGSEGSRVAVARRMADHADQQRQDPPAQGGVPGSAAAPPAAPTQLTAMLGKDQRIAAEALGAAFTAEDQQQAEVRRFRGVLFGTFASLVILVGILWLVGTIHPKFIPICFPKSGAAAGTMVCPSGGTAQGTADIALVLGFGAVGAALAVARNLAGLKPAGVRYSLSVAQGLLKVAFGAVTAVLGILILRTQTNLPGVLGTQEGLLTSAVVFGYAQQIFTGLIDRQATSLMNAASPATSPADSAAAST
jgi:hypothetical protein